MPGTGRRRVADRRFELHLRAAALRALDEPEVDPRVVAAVLGADRRHREVDLRELLQDLLDFAHLAIRVLEARADRRVEPQRDEALVGLRHELGADPAARSAKLPKNVDKRDRDDRLAMAERPFAAARP